MFKSNCRSYGLDKISVKDFYAYLMQQMQNQMDDMEALMIDLLPLIPHEEKRKNLFEMHQMMRTETSSNISSSTGSGKMGEGKIHPERKTDLIHRYTDHPNCDICRAAFEMTKRRHQCRKCGLYICSACSPARLLIPPGEEITAAKGYDPSVPQRVCISCAPKLHDLQERLGQQYGACNESNPHEARSRLHIPYSSSLAKECRNAADVLSNFFGNSNASSKDRSIPVAFLEKAHGLAIMTIVKAGFLITGKIGTGLVLGKLPDGSWSAPSAIRTAGLGGGLEIGGEIVEVMIILGSPGAVKVFHNAQLNIGAGLDLAVGPYGRSAEAAASASKAGLNANYSYSHAKGLYAGISLQGTVITTRKDVNTKFYSKQIDAKSILTGEVGRPKAAEPLYKAIEAAMRGVAQHREIQEAEAAARNAYLSNAGRLK